MESDAQASQPSGWCLAHHSQSGDVTITLSGPWTFAAGRDEQALLAQLDALTAPAIWRFETSRLTEWDSALPVLLVAVISLAEQRGASVDQTGLPNGVRGLLQLVYAVPERGAGAHASSDDSWLAVVGRYGLWFWRDAAGFVRFVGEVTQAAVALVQGRARFRSIDLWLNVQDCGPGALPIITIISVLSGLILAFVGAVQLSLFGAQAFIADLVGLGMLREMGALMTAVILSGRTGAAFAAQLGTMNVNSEIAALRVMGIQPIEFLVLPRMLGVVLVMPALCLYADVLGVLGGAWVSVGAFDISLPQYLERTREALHLRDLLVGLVKGTVFGGIIAVSGCLRGLQCGRSAAAVGDAATSAVVTGIVLIVVADAVMTLVCDVLKV